MTERDWRVRVDGLQAIALPERISPAFQRLIQNTDRQSAAALTRQVTATAAERIQVPIERADPLGEARYCVTPFLVHQYPNRVLLLATGQCLAYCRYCFRREFTARTSSFISRSNIEKAAAYIANTPHIHEVLVSGGDPLSGTFDELCYLLEKLRSIAPDLLIRLCTRAPIFAPELFTPRLMQLLRSVRPLWVIAHINHPAELGREQTQALCACIDSGIPVQSQTVLLQGVNDEASVLADLFHRLVCLGVKPGYLFQMDLAYGTSEFRVPLEKACTVWKKLKTMLSGLSLPQFAVDLPNGGGKFPLSALMIYEDIVKPLHDNQFSARGIDGGIYTYPPP